MAIHIVILSVIQDLWQYKNAFLTFTSHPRIWNNAQVLDLKKLYTHLNWGFLCVQYWNVACPVECQLTTDLVSTLNTCALSIKETSSQGMKCSITRSVLIPACLNPKNLNRAIYFFFAKIPARSKIQTREGAKFFEIWHFVGGWKTKNQEQCFFLLLKQCCVIFYY